MGIEFELKYRASAQTLAAIRQEVCGPEQVYQMQTTYYDTPDSSLSARHWTLRRRMENGQSICTLKTPASGSGRREWEVLADSIDSAVLELCKLGAPEKLMHLAQSGLIPICGARFTRIAKTVCANDSILEIALDSGVLTGGNQEIPLCEVEVELKSGSEDACRGFAAALAARYGLQPELDSKFCRALNLYKGESNGGI